MDETRQRVNLLSDWQTAATESRTRNKRLGLWVLAILIADLVVLLPLGTVASRQRERAEQLQSQATKVEQESAQLLQLEGKAKRKLAQWELVDASRRNQQRWRNLLCTTAGYLPTGVWITSLDGKEDRETIKLTVRGTSLSLDLVPEFTKALSQDPEVASVALKSAQNAQIDKQIVVHFECEIQYGHIEQEQAP